MRRKPVIVFAAGCFNRLHEAHLRMLRTARSLGDRLVVVLSNDAHNRKPNAVPAKARLAALKRLGVADKIVVGKPHSFVNSLRQEKPDILVLGYDQKMPDKDTADAVKELGVQVVQLPWFPGKEKDLPEGPCA